MTSVSDMLYHMGGVPVLQGVPFGPDSQAFFVDPDNGSDSNDGTTPASAKASLAAAYALTVADKHDVVFFLGTDSSDAPTAAITWANDFTHLIGVGSPLPGVGIRNRVVGTAANDLAKLVTFSGTGCIVANMQFANFGDADSDQGAVDVSGNRNTFINCFFAGMGHATPAARAGSYSLKVTGAENHFERCAIGLDTITRAGANAELVIADGAARCSFWDCRVMSFSDTAGKFAVSVSGLDRWVEFKDCLFQNFSTNWSQALTNAFSVTEAATHYIILRGACQFVGFTGIADTVTHIYGAGAAPNAGMFLSTQPTT